jgi:hypothetical protein
MVLPSMTMGDEAFPFFVRRASSAAAFARRSATGT